MSNNEKTPSLFEKGWDFTKTMTWFALSGFEQTTEEEYQERLEICDPCDQRLDTKCKACGCWLPAKALVKIAECPLKKWPQLEKPAEEPRRPFIISDLGDIRGEIRHVPGGWTQISVGHWAPPWGPCRHRRVSKRYSDPPVITPYCLLVNEHVTVETCLKCDVREP